MIPLFGDDRMENKAALGIIEQSGRAAASSSTVPTAPHERRRYLVVSRSQLEQTAKLDELT